MKKIVLGIAIVFSLSVFASDVVIEKTKVDCEAVIKSGDKNLIASSGCCSYHGGVSGCSGGRVVCSDGSLSPSCTCNSITPLEDHHGMNL